MANEMPTVFKEIATPPGVVLKPCPFCGSAAQLYEFQDGRSATKVVCCTRAGGEEILTEECVLYFPSQVAYKATKREAIAIWNTRADGNPAA